MDLDAIVEAISKLGGAELERVRQAVDRQREVLAQSTVVERRNYGSGILQLELRANPNTGTTRGPYWYFHYREGGKQRTLYVGKTGDPEGTLAEKLALSF